MGVNKWDKNSWRKFPIQQQPSWPDRLECENILNDLSNLPALVFAGETRTLRQQLSEVLDGKAFVLQAGDCSEDFSKCNGPRIHNQLKVILQMAVIIAYAGEKKIVKIGRIAGQYAKPRSSETEMYKGIEIPSYRGDMVNSPEPNFNDRKPNPSRMLEGYFRSTATLNLVRAFTRGGYAALDQVYSWSEANLKGLPAGEKYTEMVNGIRKSINFTKAIGLDTSNPKLNEVTLYTSHEALLLEYEEALTRIDTTTGLWYDTSAHFLWLGDRTRQYDGAHVEFLRGINNPIGIKIGPNYDLDEIKKLIKRLNPENEAGRLTLIIRFGSKKIEGLLSPLIKEIKNEGFKVIWICDPMHGNTYTSNLGHKTRLFEDILEEIRIFWKIHQTEGTIAGGVHLELTGDNVTECVGGNRQLLDNDLLINYESNCDPRLNAEQSVELAFELAKIINP